MIRVNLNARARYLAGGLATVLLTTATYGTAAPPASDTSTPPSPSLAEWRQIGGGSGYSFHIDGTIRLPLTSGIYPLERVPYAPVLVAGGDTLYVVTPARVAAYAATDRPPAVTYYHSKWQRFFGSGRDGALPGGLPHKVVASERGVFANFGGNLIDRSVRAVGLAADDGELFYRGSEDVGPWGGSGVVGTQEGLILFGSTIARDHAVVAYDPTAKQVRWRMPGEPGYHFGEIGGPSGWLFRQNGGIISSYDPVARRERSYRWTVWASPVKAAVGRMYITDHTTRHRVVFALDERGKEIWRWKLPHRGTCAVRVVTADYVITEGAGYLFALGGRDGRLQWKKRIRVHPRLPEEVSYAPGHPFALSWHSCIGVGSTLFVTSSSPGKDYVDTINALDVRTGRKLWSESFRYSLGPVIPHQGALHCLANSLDGFSSAWIRLEPSSR
ncbi:MAG TPA: PQQ-binding-like beta-propeller repeat protein [Armatimonadota bacterium]|nr:PQQ-binding-like beta-propeller repeat protein [Armatimonadota bacterium]